MDRDTRNFVRKGARKAWGKKGTRPYETNATVTSAGKTPMVLIDGASKPTKATLYSSSKKGDRVRVRVSKDGVRVIGNETSPATDDKVARGARRVADDAKVIAKEIQAETARFGELIAGKATVEDLEATNASVLRLEVGKADVESLSAVNAEIGRLDAEKLSANDLDATYANIDFSNIGDAAIERIFAGTGMVEDLVVGDSMITGRLVGVTISGDLIEGNTIKADKLVVAGEDGLYYKLNVNSLGEATASSDAKYQSGLDGSAIIARSITAEKVSVNDLVAFGATIGGYHIGDNSLYSGVKSSASNTTRGVYMDSDGQFALGDSTNYLRFFKDGNQYKLDISASSLTMSATGKTVEQAIEELGESAITSTEEQFYKSTSATSLVGGSWSAAQPTWEDGKYIWRRTLVTFGDGSTKYTPSANGVCITGSTGPQGPQGNTGATGTGISSITTEFYLSTAKTTQSGGSWVTTMPAWTQGKYLWTRSKIVYSNPTSTVYTTPVCDSGWEAVNDISIGGKNLVKYSDVATTNTSYNIQNYELTEDLVVGEKYVLTIWGSVAANKSFGVWLANGNRVMFPVSAMKVVSPGVFQWDAVACPTSPNENYRKIHVYHYPSGTSGTGTITRIKLERGTKATDWSPAPEKVSDDIGAVRTTANSASTAAANAAKTATNFMSFDSSNGLVIADKTAATLGNNVQITSNSVNVRDGSTNRASFGETTTIGDTSTRHLHLNKGVFGFYRGQASLASFNAASAGEGFYLNLYTSLFRIDSFGDPFLENNATAQLVVYGSGTTGYASLNASLNDVNTCRIKACHDGVAEIYAKSQVNIRCDNTTVGWSVAKTTSNDAGLGTNYNFGTLGKITAGSHAALFTDQEGGTLQLKSPTGSYAHMDLYNGNFRCYYVDRAGTYKGSIGMDANGAFTASNVSQTRANLGVPAIAVDGSGYYTICKSDGSSGTYMKAPSSGILPQSSSTTGVGYIGTPAWPFQYGYFASILLVGNASVSGDRQVKAMNSSNNVKLLAATNAGVYHDSDSGYGTAGWLISISTAGAITTKTTSDRRLKDDLGDMPEDEALTLLREVPIHNFTYKADTEGTVYNGVIAQEVRDVLREHGIGNRPYLVVETTDSEDTSMSFDVGIEESDDVIYGIDYQKLVPILWKGWQVHEERIAELEAAASKADERIAELEMKVEALLSAQSQLSTESSDSPA